MSQENVEVVKRCYADLNNAYRSGAYGRRFEELAHPDVVLRTSGMFPESGEYHGYEGLRRFAENQAEAFEAMSIEPLEMIDAGDRVVVPTSFGGKARHTGIPATFAVVHVWTMREGKVAALDMYRDRSEALKAVGLEE
jgi:hypothetical protein